MSEKWLVVGICGVTCGGKTTLASELNKLLPNSLVISQDDYYLDVDDPRHVKIPELDHLNFELLTSLDMEQMHKDIANILNSQTDRKRQEPRRKPESFRSIASADEDVQKVVRNKIKTSGTHVLIVEGFSILNYKPIDAFCDLKYYVTLNKNECFARREKRVYEPPDCPGYFEKVVWPEYLKLLADVQKNVRNVKYFDEYTVDPLRKVLVDILGML